MPTILGHKYHFRPQRDTGWDKVGKLAEYLVQLTGIAVSAAQATQVKALYYALDIFDRQATKVLLRSQPHLRGRFCSQKRMGHTTREQMRRFIMKCLLQIQ